MTTSRRSMAMSAALLLALPATAHQGNHETVRPAYSQAIPNLPGKTLTSVIVTYPPGVKSPTHRHAPSAFIYAFVLDGEIRSQVDDAAPRVFHAGESWTETPGAHHRISENASKTRQARLLAVFIADTGDARLTIPDTTQGAM